MLRFKLLEAQLYLSKNFSSEDGEHNFFVSHAAWTPNSQFFVFSIYSSGGHQPWHWPTYFFCQCDRQLRLLDDYLGPLTKPNFELSAPDIIHTTKLKAYDNLVSVAAEAKLSTLIKQQSKR
ncbi:MAG: hypothetical protein EXR70_10800 [Deltaproteobacteria bacterium]|nr:hypothetical protein [Deltaproteobacteria bacterium]